MRSMRVTVTSSADVEDDGALVGGVLSAAVAGSDAGMVNAFFLLYFLHL